MSVGFKFEGIYEEFKFGVPANRVLSGTVKDTEGTPLKRTVLLFRTVYYEVLTDRLTGKIPAQTTESSAVDGSFSFTVQGLDDDRWMVLVVGLNGENHAVFNNLIAV